MLTLTRPAANGHITDPVGPQSPLVRELIAAYWHEIETVSHHVASSTNRGGIRGERIARSIRETIAADLKHAQQVADRIRGLHAAAPRIDEFATRHPRLRPPAEPLDNASLVTGLIEAETAAIERYRRIAAVASESRDWITDALANRIMREKEIHREALAAVLATEQ
ncbi:MAG: ferritin-like domain-containing protein [Solirubrobacteraceae bacterium]